MIISKEKLIKIKNIIERHYNNLTISVLGNSVFTPQELRQLKALGLDTSNPDSFLDLVYNHNYLNEQGKANNPTSTEDMQSQQKIPGIKPTGDAHTAATEHLNENAKHLLDKLKNDVKSKMESIIRDTNNDYRMNALQNLTRTLESDNLVKESTLGKLKQQLRDFSEEPNRNWNRVVRTEMSNAVGLGSIDRIVTDNRDKQAEEVYVYRISVLDGALCKWCRKFYVDSDGSPKVYKLSELLNNGTNYGKKVAEWRPVTTATHPNCRESQIIELRPGWMVKPGGTVTFIGLDKWKDYILNKVQ